MIVSYNVVSFFLYLVSTYWIMCFSLFSNQLATQCMKECKRSAIQSQKVMKETPTRARRLCKEMQVYWKRFEKVEKEHRKRAEKEALEQRKMDHELAEVNWMIVTPEKI